MLECILPAVLEMERHLLAFKTGDRSMLLWDILEFHETKDYDTGLALLEDLLSMPDVRAVEEWEKMKPVSEHYKYPAPL